MHLCDAYVPLTPPAAGVSGLMHGQQTEVATDSLAGRKSPHSSTAAARPTKPSGRPPANMPAPPANMPAPGTAAHEAAEKAVTGADAAKAQAAAVKAVGSGTAGDVTTDYFGKGYEVTVTKADGSTVEVHLDSSFNAMPFPPRGGRMGWGGPPPSSSGFSN